MYKYLMATFFLVLFVLFLEPAQKLLSNFLRLEQPTLHQIEEGEWLSKVARQYYGDPSFAKELALINRAPDNDLIFPGEKIIVPDFENIQKIRHTRQLSVVNYLVSEQQALLNSSVYSTREVRTNEGAEIAAIPADRIPESTLKDDLEIMDQVTAMETMMEKSTFNPGGFSNKIILGSALFGGLLFIAGIIYAVRKKKGSEEVTVYGASAESSTDLERSIYLDDFGEKEIASEKEEQKKEIELV